MPIVIDKDKTPKLVTRLGLKPLPKPADRYQAILDGPATQPSAGEQEPLASFKRVHFNKDIVVEKLTTFRDIISYFNSLEKTEHGGPAARNAYDWVVRQFADDLFDALSLDKFEWEFDALMKLQMRQKRPAPDFAAREDAELNKILVNGPVSNFISGVGHDRFDLPEGTYHNGIHIDLDDEETKKEFKHQVASRNRIKKRIQAEKAEGEGAEKKVTVNEFKKIKALDWEQVARNLGLDGDKPKIREIKARNPIAETTEAFAGEPTGVFRDQLRFMSDEAKCQILEDSFPHVKKDLWGQTRSSLDEDDPRFQFRIDLGRIKDYLDLCKKQREEQQAKEEAELKQKEEESKRLAKAAKRAVSRKKAAKKKRK